MAPTMLPLASASCLYNMQSGSWPCALATHCMLIADMLTGRLYHLYVSLYINSCLPAYSINSKLPYLLVVLLFYPLLSSWLPTILADQACLLCISSITCMPLHLSSYWLVCVLSCRQTHPPQLCLYNWYISKPFGASLQITFHVLSSN